MGAGGGAEEQLRDGPSGGHDARPSARLAAIGEPVSEPSGRAVLALLLATLIVPAAIALSSVQAPRPKLDVAPDPTPLGYTLSLALFFVPIAVLLVWFVRAPLRPLVRPAFFRALPALIATGFALDGFFATAFFRFENHAATLGVGVPVLGGAVPIEEHLFYAAGFFATLLTYVWCDESWLRAYSVPDPVAAAPEAWARRRLAWGAVPLGLLLVAAAIGVRALLAGPDGFPGYFAYLVTVALVPTWLLMPTVERLINWRALAFTLVLLVLVSLMWESTLGIPYRWWGYREEWMMGVFVNAWSGLPVEEPLVWVVTTYTTVVVYESVKLLLAVAAAARVRSQ